VFWLTKRIAEELRRYDWHPFRDDQQVAVSRDPSGGFTAERTGVRRPPDHPRGTS
jgi:hypothetical protein